MWHIVPMAPQETAHENRPLRPLGLVAFVEVRAAASTSGWLVVRHRVDVLFQHTLHATMQDSRILPDVIFNPVVARGYPTSNPNFPERVAAEPL